MTPDKKPRAAIEFLKSLGIPEDTSRYEKEKGITTLRFAPLRKKKKPTP